MKTYKILLTFFLILISGMGFSQSVPSYVPTSGLVGWWGFNGNAQDGSGNGNHLVNNSCTFTLNRHGQINSAIDLVGPNKWLGGSVIQTTVQPVLPNLSTSMSMWCKVVNISFGEIYHQGTGSSGFGLYLQGGSTLLGTKLFVLDNGVNGNVTNIQNGGFDLGLGQWKHIVLSKVGNQVDLYINGLFHSNGFLSLNAVNSGWLNFGVPDIGEGNVDVHLDDIGIWNRALTPQEITNLYNSQLPTQYSLCLPTITTSSPSSVGVDSVVIGGDISNDGGSSIVLRGICYSTSPNPNMGNQRTEDGSGTGSFNTVLRGLTSSTTYYARSYAKNSNGVVVYGNEVSFTTIASLPGVRCPGTPTVTDIDGNIYNTVQIGNQCWTQSNLKTSRYRNGDNIPTGLTNSAWGNTTSGAYGIYNNDTSVVPLYGLHYNGYAVNDIRGICPAGWQVPTDNDLTTLVNFLGGDSIAGGHLKSVNVGFSQPNSGASNSSGFSGVAAGYFGPIGGNTDLWVNSYVWSRNSANSNLAWVRYLHYLNTRVYRFQYGMTWGFSVRCLKNTLPQVNTTSVTNVTPSTALVTSEVISNGGDQNTTRGFCYSTISNPTISNDTTMNGTGIGVYSDTLQNLTPSTTYYVRAYATNSIGTSYGNEVSITTTVPPQPCPGTPTVTDIDGNVYNTVQIGTQCWTKSNLKVSKYRNGDNIPTGLSSSDWQNTYSAAYAIYDNDPVNDSLYGKLYNHYAVTDSRGLCPTGWHVPSDGEWTTLENHLGGSIVAGDALRSTATQPTPGGWNPPNTGATNSSGFTALPGGLRASYMYDFGGMTFMGCWWSSSFRTAMEPLTRYLYGSASIVDRGSNVRGMGFSVRCLKNTLPQVNTTSITNVTPSTALITGEVISEGDQNTTRGFCYSTTSNPTISNDTTMNGTGAGVYSDTLLNLTPSTAFYVRAYATNSLGTSYGSELNFTTDSIRIGSNYAGGIVFYIDSTGQHGLVCAPNDQGNYQWGCVGTNIEGTSLGIGTSQANTSQILSGCPTRPIAASICDNLVLNGYSDWYLPSLAELQLMYLNLRVQNIGGFVNPYFWSSSQFHPNFAWGINFINGSIGNDAKHFSNYVRAVRSF